MARLCRRLEPRQAKCVVEKHLSEYLLNPQIPSTCSPYKARCSTSFSTAAASANASLPAGHRQRNRARRLGYVQGWPPFPHASHLAGPAFTVHNGCNQILPVDWKAITMAGPTGTNYKSSPATAVYVSADCLITFDNYLVKVLAPWNVSWGSLSWAPTWPRLPEPRTGTGTGTAVIVP